MNQKSALRSLFVNNSNEKFSSGFIGMPVLVMIIVAVAAIAVTAKSYEKLHVLGTSTLIAQTPPQGQSAPQPQQLQQQPQSQPQQQQSQPQQPSQPQNQPPQSQQAPQNNQGSQPQPQQNNQLNNQTGQTPQGNNQQWQQNSGQQYGNQQGGYNGNQPGSNQQGNNYSGQNGGYGQNNQGSPNGNTGNFPGTQGQPVGSQNQQGASNNPQTVSAQDQQRYQQMQQQWQQEAAKSGFQLNGNLPQQYFQQQTPSGNNQGQTNQGGQGNSGNQTPHFNPNNFQALPPANSFPTIRGDFKVNTTNGQNSINLNDPNTKIQLGITSLQAVKLDGTPVPIEKSALEKIATAIKLETGVDFAQNGNTLALKRGQVEADTTLSISFNVATKTFSVQTPSGEQEVKTLPDQAVQKLLQDKILSNIQTNNTTPSGNNSTSSPTVQLTELNNKLVYQVQGTNQKKFLGFIPVSISKTVFVSTSTGQQVLTNQSFLSNLLDKLSQ